MSDLHCPARIYVARHGEADYESELLSDAGGSLSRRGREQSKELGESLRGARISRIYASSMARAVQTAEIVAAILGVDVVVREGLREFGVGVHAGGPGDPDPFRPTFVRWLDGDLAARIEGAESGTELIDRVGNELELVADQHRGESALVISHGGAICAAVPALAHNLTSRFPESRAILNTGVVELEADADGWRAVSWCGEPIPAR
ncbi:MAG TPA: histidine phosphatase family protein [Nocardioides sp.]|nr:histidine phosphatase family protein [Nocardioides sp.]